MSQEQKPIKIVKAPSQIEIAEALGVSQGYISMILNGKRKNPELVKKIKERYKSFIKAA